MKVLLKNANETSGLQPPSPYSTWLEYWEGETGSKLNENKVYECPACGKGVNRADFDGCHVQKVYDRNKKMYIVPLCSGCNHRNDSFFVDEDLLAPAP